MERYTLEDLEAYRKEQDEKAAKEAEEQRERMEKETARRAWLADGGTEANFQREWPELRDEGRRRRVVDADRRAREEMQASRVSRI
jgi:Fe-S oxidoreductase